jgi:T5SS/PEP-CTERM-associated repeat protein
VVKFCRVRLRWLFPSLGGLSLFFASDGFAAAIWTNPGDGFWRDGTNWSSGRVPSADGGSTLITNANTKTVTIDAFTLSTNLTINSLTISGSATTTNTLLLQDAGTNNPLTLVSSELKLAQGGALIITNSSLVLTGSFSQGLNLLAGDIVLHSGSIRIVEDPAVTNITVLARIGRTNAASLTINGGTMEAGTLRLGETPFVQFASQGTVRITGGLVSLSSELSVGDGISGTGLVEVLGGQLRVANNQTNITRVGDAGVGQLVVSNASAYIGNVSVARHDGARGTLIVQSNGLVHLTDDLSIGRFSGATGEVLVAGGQLEVVDNQIWVGREGLGRLTVSSGLAQAQSLEVAAVATNTSFGTVMLIGGSLVLSSNLVVGSESNSIAEMVVNGGVLTVTNSNASALFDFRRGVFTMEGGTMTVDRLLVTNSGAQFVGNGGAVRARGTRVSNGRPFVVGDGTKPAVFELLGGTHSFSDGLVISSNATLKGCGTIVGNIVNHGTIATNCSAVPTRPVIVNVDRTGNAVRFSFDSENGFAYTVEHKIVLNDPSWTVLRTETGTGSSISITNTIGPEPTRFYRVRVE